MIIPDANLLIYSHDANSPFYEKARDWWIACLSGEEPVGLCHPVIFAFLRIITNGKIFETPLTVNEASSYVQTWLARDVCQLIIEDRSHAKRTVDLLMAAGSAGGNLVTDAQIASLAVTHKGTVHTSDTDFLRFEIPTVFPLNNK